MEIIFSAFLFFFSVLLYTLQFSFMTELKSFVLICASQNYKEVLFIRALILVAGEIMPFKLKARMRCNFWKIQFLFFSDIWVGCSQYFYVIRTESKETISQDHLLFTIEVCGVFLYNGKIVLFKRSSNALMWLSNEVVQTKGQSLRHYSRDRMTKMQTYCTTVNPNSVR